MFDTTPVIVEVVFDENNPNWLSNKEHNWFFLRASQNYANDKLAAKGHLFLNDVLDILSIRRTPEGAIGGWLRDVNGGFIDFGIWTEDGMVASPGAITLKLSIIPDMHAHI